MNTETKTQAQDSSFRTFLGKHMIPLDKIDAHAGAEGVLAYLRKIGVVKVKTFAGRKILVVSDFFKGRRVGRVVWLSCRTSFEDCDRTVCEAEPKFCVTSDAAKELIKLYERAACRGSCGCGRTEVEDE